MIEDEEDEDEHYYVIRRWEGVSFKPILSVGNYLSLDTECVVAGCSDRTIRFLDPDSLEEVSKATTDKKNVSFVAISGMSPDGDDPVIITGGKDSTLQVWNPIDGCVERSITVPTAEVRSISVYQGSRTLVVIGAKNGQVFVWDIVENVQIAQFRGHQASVHCVCIALTTTDIENFEDDLNHLCIASGGADRCVRTWNLLTDKRDKKFRHERSISSIVVTNKGLRPLLATAGVERVIKLWDLESGVLLRSLHGHLDKITSLALWEGYQMLLISGSADHTIRVFDMLSGECLVVLKGHRDGVLSLAITTVDDPKVISSSEDLSIIQWDLHQIIADYYEIEGDNIGARNDRPAYIPDLSYEAPEELDRQKLSKEERKRIRRERKRAQRKRNLSRGWKRTKSREDSNNGGEYDLDLDLDEDDDLMDIDNENMNQFEAEDMEKEKKIGEGKENEITMEKEDRIETRQDSLDQKQQLAEFADESAATTSETAAESIKENDEGNERMKDMHSHELTEDEDMRDYGDGDSLLSLSMQNDDVYVMDDATHQTHHLVSKDDDVQSAEPVIRVRISDAQRNAAKSTIAHAVSSAMSRIVPHSLQTVKHDKHDVSTKDIAKSKAADSVLQSSKRKDSHSLQSSSWPGSLGRSESTERIVILRRSRSIVRGMLENVLGMRSTVAVEIVPSTEPESLSPSMAASPAAVDNKPTTIPSFVVRTANDAVHVVSSVSVNSSLSSPAALPSLSSRRPSHKSESKQIERERNVANIALEQKTETEAKQVHDKVSSNSAATVDARLSISEKITSPASSQTAVSHNHTHTSTRTSPPAHNHSPTHTSTTLVHTESPTHILTQQTAVHTSAHIDTSHKPTHHTQKPPSPDKVSLPQEQVSSSNPQRKPSAPSILQPALAVTHSVVTPTDIHMSDKSDSKDKGLSPSNKVYESSLPSTPSRKIGGKTEPEDYRLLALQTKNKHDVAVVEHQMATDRLKSMASEKLARRLNKKRKQGDSTDECDEPTEKKEETAGDMDIHALKAKKLEQHRLQEARRKENMLIAKQRSASALQKRLDDIAARKLEQEKKSKLGLAPKEIFESADQNLSDDE